MLSMYSIKPLFAASGKQKNFAMQKMSCILAWNTSVGTFSRDACSLCSISADNEVERVFDSVWNANVLKLAGKDEFSIDFAQAASERHADRTDFYSLQLDLSITIRVI